jgi:ComEC/Rec2-related protein
MARLLSFLVCAFACGIVLERAVGDGVSCGVYLACAGVLYAAAVCSRWVWTRHRGSLLFTTSSVFFFVAVGAATSSLERSVLPSHIANFYLDNADLSMYTVEGTVTDIGTPGNRRCVLKLMHISSGQAGHLCSGDITVVPVPDLPLSCGQRLVVRGEVRRKYPYRAQASAGFCARFGVKRQPRFTVSSLPPGGVRVFSQAPWYCVSRVRGALKWKIAQIIENKLSPLTAKILEALLLGERQDFPRFVTASLMRTGTIHIISISGFHVGLIAYLLKEMLKIFRVPRAARIAVIIPLLLFYCALTGASSPVARSTIMGIVFLGAYSLRKEPDVLHSLSLAGLCLLAMAPADVFTTSFQLSFASVLSIALFYPRFISMVPVQWMECRPMRIFLSGIIVSLSAWLGTAAIVAVTFKIVTPVTLIANIVIVPLSVLLMCSGLVFVAAGIFLPCAANACAVSVEAATSLLLHVNALFTHLPGAYFYLPPG